MKDFLFTGSWFETKYREKSDGRYNTFKAALNLLLQNGGKNIVETGTTRMVDDWGAGSSTILFGDFLAHYTGHLWTVDVEPRNIEVCKQVTAQYSSFITYVVADSHLFLKGFDQPIDLLYLDSVDFPLDGSDPTPCQQHQLEEFIIAEPKLAKDGVILLDDNNFPTGGKTKLTKDYLIRKGYRCVLDSQQTLWI